MDLAASWTNMPPGGTSFKVLDGRVDWRIHVDIKDGPPGVELFVTASNGVRFHPVRKSGNGGDPIGTERYFVDIHPGELGISPRSLTVVSIAIEARAGEQTVKARLVALSRWHVVLARLILLAAVPAMIVVGYVFSALEDDDLVAAIVRVGAGLAGSIGATVALHLTNSTRFPMLGLGHRIYRASAAVLALYCCAFVLPARLLMRIWNDTELEIRLTPGTRPLTLKPRRWTTSLGYPDALEPIFLDQDFAVSPHDALCVFGVPGTRVACAQHVTPKTGALARFLSIPQAGIECRDRYEDIPQNALATPCKTPLDGSCRVALRTAQCEPIGETNVRIAPRWLADRSAAACVDSVVVPSSIVIMHLPAIELLSRAKRPIYKSLCITDQGNNTAVWRRSDEQAAAPGITRVAWLASGEHETAMPVPVDPGGTEPVHVTFEDSADAVLGKLECDIGAALTAQVGVIEGLEVLAARATLGSKGARWDATVNSSGTRAWLCALRGPADPKVPELVMTLKPAAAARTSFTLSRELSRVRVVIDIEQQGRVQCEQARDGRYQLLRAARADHADGTAQIAGSTWRPIDSGLRQLWICVSEDHPGDEWKGLIGGTPVHYDVSTGFVSTSKGPTCCTPNTQGVCCPSTAPCEPVQASAACPKMWSCKC